MIYKSRALDFAFRKPEFSTIYYTYSNESPSKYYISVLGGVGGLRPCLFCLFRGGWGVQNLGKPAYIILERSLIGDGSIGYGSIYNGSISIGGIGIGSISID